MRSSSGLLLLFAAIPSIAAPQTPVVPHAAESVEVSIVNVDAVVVDKQGKRVQGLLRVRSAGIEYYALKSWIGRLDERLARIESEVQSLNGRMGRVET